MKKNKTLLIDNFDSFTYNLYQIIGELGGNPAVIRNNQLSLNKVIHGKFSRIVISPGPGSPEDPAYFGNCREIILKLGGSIPILGICLGHQGIISSYGGRIIPAGTIKHGKQSRIRHDGKFIFKNVRNPLSGMRYHSLMGDKSSLPDSLEISATSEGDGIIMAIRHKKFPVFGVQFHPESVGTDDGKIIIRNFLEII